MKSFIVVRVIPLSVTVAAFVGGVKLPHNF